MFWLVGKYIIEVLITKVFGYATSWFVYPFSYVLRKQLRNLRKSEKQWKKVLALPLWMYLNDGVSGDGLVCIPQGNGRYNYDWFWIKIGRYPSWHESNNNKGKFSKWWNDFVISYKWSGLRNVVWNLYTLPFFKCERGVKTDIVINKSVCFNEYFADHEILPEEDRHMKFKYADGGDADNEGPYLNYRRAVLGVLSCTYEVNGRKYFRWHKVYVKRGKNCLIGREIRFGYTDNHSDLFNKKKRLILDEKSLSEYNEYIKYKIIK